MGKEGLLVGDGFIRTYKLLSTSNINIFASHVGDHIEFGPRECDPSSGSIPTT